MNLKKISIILSIFVWLFVFPVTKPVQALSLSDLTPFGVPSMKVSRGRAAVLDGKITDGEYGEGVTFKENQGLCFLNDGVYQIAGSSVGATQENFVLLSGNYVYCGLRLTLPSERGTVSSALRNGIQCHRITFSIGIADGDHPALKGSLLSNTYYFSDDDDICVGFAGERIARSLREPSVVSKPLSTFTEIYVKNGIVSADGTKWNAEYYCKNAVLSLEETANGTILVAEVKIPLEDVLLSVLPSDRATVAALLKDPSKTLCGNFSTEVDLDAVSCAVTGVPSEIAIPGSSGGQTLFNWMLNDFETPVSGSYIPSVVPIPLYWGELPTVEGEVPTITNEEASVLQDEIPVTTTVVSSSAYQAPLPEESSSAVSENSLISGEEPLAENVESVFESLPDADSRLPEDTEIIYDEPVSSEKESQEKSLLSAVIATASGVLLFASVMVLCIYFRERGKEEEKKRQDQRRSKKKSKSKKKDGRGD